MGKKASAPPPPDYSALAKSSEKMAELSYKLAKEQFEWAKKSYNENKGLVDQVTKSFLQTMESSRISAEEDRARYKEKFQPQEDALLADIESMGSQGRRDQEVGAAQASVAQQMGAARESAQRQLESFGVNPSATRFAALDVGLRADEATAKAAAGNNASRALDDRTRAMRSEAINIGKGYPSQIAGQYATQMGAGGGTVNSAIGNYTAGANAMGTGPQWAGVGNQAIANWGNVLTDSYKSQIEGFKMNQSQSSGWGQVAGLGVGIGMKFLGLKEGGAVPIGASPSGGAVPDDVPAALTAGEFVVPEDVVKWKGEEFFHKLAAKSKQDMKESGAIPGASRMRPEGRVGAI